MRFEKLTTNSEIAGSVNHTLRINHTPNANPNIKNIIVHGTPAIAPAIHDKLDGLARRKNSVATLEFLLTASPEFFDDIDPKKYDAWIKANCNWLARTFGKNNIASIVLHRDEKTPHLVAYITPIKDGKLNASHWIGKLKQYTEMQTSYAKAMKKFGLKRGQEKSKATHKKVQQFYADINAPVPELPQPTLSQMVKGSYLDDIKDDLETINNKAKALDFEESRSRGLEAKNKDLSKKLAGSKKALKKTAEQRDKAKEQLDKLRALPLPLVAERLGLVLDVDGNFKDSDKRFAITIKDDRKFYCHKSSTGGGGSIDLVKTVLDCDFNEAKAWLFQHYGGASLVAEAVDSQIKETKQLAEKVRKGETGFKPPAPDPSKWQQVKRYLTVARGLSSKLVDGIHKQGKVYADALANVVFVGTHHASKRGTGTNSFKGLHLGSDRREAWRCVVGKSEDFDNALVIAESPIDALSYMQANRVTGTAAATNGVTSKTPSNLLAAAWRKIIIAYDNDATGNENAEALAKDLKNKGFTSIERHAPPVGFKDWNEHLTSNPKVKDRLNQGMPPNDQSQVDLNAPKGSTSPDDESDREARRGFKP